MSNTVTAIVLFRGDTPHQAREMLCAAQSASDRPIELWVYGNDIDRYSDLPVSKILFIHDDGNLVADRFLLFVFCMLIERSCELMLVRSNALGDELVVRLGYLIGCSCATAISGISTHSQGLCVTRRVFGMRMEAEYLFRKTPFIFSVSKDSFAPVYTTGAPAITKYRDSIVAFSWYTDYEEQAAPVERSMDSYQLVLAGGRGLGNAAAAGRMEELGVSLGAGIGSTRAAALNGWFPINKMIGISGATASPKVCLLFGISGCIPFMKGVEKSKKLIAVNNDPNAQIFKHCDLGVVADCNQVIEYLHEIIGNTSKYNC